MDSERWLTVPEVAKLLRVGPETVRRMLRDGRLKGSMPVSARAGWLVAESEVRRLLGGASTPAPMTPRPNGQA